MKRFVGQAVTCAPDMLSLVPGVWDVRFFHLHEGDATQLIGYRVGKGWDGNDSSLTLSHM